MTEKLDEMFARAVGTMRGLERTAVGPPEGPEGARRLLEVYDGDAPHVCGRGSLRRNALCRPGAEPIALYHSRDLHEENAKLWLSRYAAPEDWLSGHVPIGRGRTHGDGTDLTIITSANGLFLSMRAAQRLARSGVSLRILDLRWWVPLPAEDILREAQVTGRALVVDETRRSGGVSEGSSPPWSTEASPAPSGG